jgi:hypothetical protein
MAPVTWLGVWLLIDDWIFFGTGRSSIHFFFVLANPWVWSGVIAFNLHSDRRLAVNQYVLRSAFALIILQILSLGWAFGAGGIIYDMTMGFGEPARREADPLTIGLVILGFAPMWFAAFMALKTPPRPLGSSSAENLSTPFAVRR